MTIHPHASHGAQQHVLRAAQFDKQRLEALVILARQIKTLAKTDQGARWLQQQLPHKRAALYFSQPSTRTKLSFHSALTMLGMAPLNIGSLSELSASKGESEADLLRVIGKNVDMIVMRSPSETLAEEVAASCEHDMFVVNAGAGKKEHPTQSLLDYLTVRDGLHDNLEGKRFTFAGDLARGRASRSFMLLLSQFPGVEIVCVAPEHLQIDSDLQEYLRQQKNIQLTLTDDYEEAIQIADVLYMMRMQDEWAQDGIKAKSFEKNPYRLGTQEIAMLKPDCMIMHPLPRRGELPVEVDSDPRAWYWQQVENGLWMRCAVIASIFGIASDILAAQP